MAKGKIVAISIGIAIVAIVGVGVALSTQPGSIELAEEIGVGGESENKTQGQHHEVDLTENVGVGDKP